MERKKETNKQAKQINKQKTNKKAKKINNNNSNNKQNPDRQTDRQTIIYY